MAEKPLAGFNSDVHIRVPGDFVSMVHMVARAKGMTASNFMRNAIIDAMQRSGVQYATPGNDGRQT